MYDICTSNEKYEKYCGAGYKIKNKGLKLSIRTFTVIKKITIIHDNVNYTF